MAPVLALLTVVVLSGACAAARDPSATAPASDVATRGIPTGLAALGDLYFEPNRGQVQGDAAYVGRGRGIQVFAAPTWVGLAFPRAAAADGPAAIAGLRLTFAGATTTPQLSGARPPVARTNYLAGSVVPPAILDVPRLGRVRYADLCPGIDLVIYARDGNVEYDFEVAPGADPTAIRLRFDGADAMRLRADGSLEFDVAGRRLRQHPPAIHQRDRGGRSSAATGSAAATSWASGWAITIRPWRWSSTRCWRFQPT